MRYILTENKRKKKPNTYVQNLGMTHMWTVIISIFDYTNKN